MLISSPWIDALHVNGPACVHQQIDNLKEKRQMRNVDIKIQQGDVQQSSEKVYQSDLITNRNGIGLSEFLRRSNINE